MEKCIRDVKSWMLCNKLQMNNDKTEAILIATQMTHIPHALPSALSINGIPIEFIKPLRNLGIISEKSFSLHQNIMKTCKAVYIELKQIISIRHFLSVDATKTRTFETWLLQFSTVWFSIVPHSTISESSKYSCSDNS